MNFSSVNPATGETVWTGAAATAAGVGEAVARARDAFAAWSRTALAEREAHLRSFARVLETHKQRLAAAISAEIGKPEWEALGEVQSMIAKVEFSVQAHARRCMEFRGGPAVTRFRPHGVLAVFGPFNFPGHLPNGHIVPALLAGNTVVFKPSECAPLVAELTLAAWREAGLPADVLQVVQGGRATGAALAGHAGIDGVLFTGSGRTGQWLAEWLARTTAKILALEMGGNNPLVVWQPRDLTAAAWLTVQSAYLTAGQRCTCARRLIVRADSEGDAFLAELTRCIGRIRVGRSFDRPEPFMGPVISARAAEAVLKAQADLVTVGARSLVAVRSLQSGTGLLSPGLVDVTPVRERNDEEIFGPLLQVIRVADFEAALAEANRTRYGLAAGFIGDDADEYARFRDAVRAGVVNWNQPLPGATGAAPFGGVGASGNHRPSGFFAADYCSYPVASMESERAVLAAALPPGLDAA